jgi:hypothetical protein
MVLLTNGSRTFSRAGQNFPALLGWMGTYWPHISHEEEDLMIPIQISPQDMDQLNKERYTHPHPRVQRKLHALYLVGLGYSRPPGARGWEEG